MLLICISATRTIFTRWTGLDSPVLTGSPISIRELSPRTDLSRRHRWLVQRSVLCHSPDWLAWLFCDDCFGHLKKAVSKSPAVGASFTYIFLSHHPFCKQSFSTACLRCSLAKVCCLYCSAVLFHGSRWSFYHFWAGQPASALVQLFH